MRLKKIWRLKRLTIGKDENKMANKISFKEMLKRSNLTAGRKKLKLDELIEKYPGGVTITDVEFVDGDTPFCRFTFAEDDDAHSNAAGEMVQTYMTILKSFEGDIDATRKYWREERPRVRFKKVRCKNGNTFTQMEMAE